MKELMRTINGQHYIIQENKDRLKELNIKVGRGSRSIYLIFFSIQQFEEFNNEFVYPKDVLIVLQEFARDKKFVHYSRKIDPELVIRGGLVSKKEGFLGEGIYAIHEDDFVNSGIGEQNMTNMLSSYQRNKIGYYLGSSMVVFNYTGPFMTVINGEGRENIVRIMSKAIPEDQVVSVFEETIEYTLS